MRFTQRRIGNPLTQWESSENTDCVLRRGNVSSLYSLFSWFRYALCGSFSHRVKRENDGGGVRRRTEAGRKYLLHSTPWDFWNSVRQLTEQAVFLIYRQNVNQASVSKVRVPVQTFEYTFHQQGYLELREWNDDILLIFFIWFYFYFQLVNLLRPRTYETYDPEVAEASVNKNRRVKWLTKQRW